MINGNPIIANDFITLKNKIKNEVKRRKYVGSVEGYGGTQYDYTETPSQFETIKTEHMSKITECVGAINDTNVNRVSNNGDTITKLAVIDAEITRFEVANMVGTNTGCKSSCTGLCSSSCSGTCTSGCSGTCSGCSGCGGACSYGCSGGCSGCGGACSSGCSGGCTNNCTGSCGSYCGGSCSGPEFCSGGCSGCCTGCDSHSSAKAISTKLGEI